MRANNIVELGQTVPSGKLAHLYGAVVPFQNLDTDGKTVRDQRVVWKMFVKNVHSTVILPKTLVSFKTLVNGKHVIPTAAAAAAIVHGVVDHLIPAAGVAVNEGFWMTIAGPAMFLNDDGGALAEYDKIIVSAAVAGLVKEGGATPTYDLVGYAEEAAAAAAGATLAQGVSFWGVFQSMFIGP